MTDPYLDFDTSVDRLLEVYKKHGTLIVGFDFDDTIFDFHDAGHTYPKVIALLQECSRLNFTMVLLTTKETQEEMYDCISYCTKNSIYTNFVNQSPIFPLASKPYVNILLDDKAGLSEAYDILNYVVGLVTHQKKT